MANFFDAFTKKKEYLVCVDSDGCAMDTMDIKHIRCFGPKMVEVFGLEENAEEILTRWNIINLYSLTRGINRFKGLAKALEEVNAKYKKIEGIEVLLNWAETTNELSESSLERAIASDDNICLRKALEWSKKVNIAITELPEEENLPYKGAKEALAFIHQYADVAIVSSANPEAVKEEWHRHELDLHVDVMLAQDAGTKAYCIGELKKKGYENHKVIMIGDAIGDLEAAKANDVLFYPIKVKQEEMSWNNLVEKVMNQFMEGSFIGEEQEKVITDFINHLESKSV